MRFVEGTRVHYLSVINESLTEIGYEAETKDEVVEFFNAIGIGIELSNDIDEYTYPEGYKVYNRLSYEYYKELSSSHNPIIKQHKLLKVKEWYEVSEKFPALIKYEGRFVVAKSYNDCKSHPRIVTYSYNIYDLENVELIQDNLDRKYKLKG